MNKIKLIFTGDLFLGGDFLHKTFAENNFDELLLNKLKNSDYIITDFENIIGKYSTIRKHRDSILYCSLDTFASYYNLFPNSIFCLGNNHINDFGIIGFNQTIKILQKYNIKFYGAGSIVDAKKPLIFEDKVILVNFSTNEFFVNSVIASKNMIGCCKYDINEIENVINKINLKGKILVITLHWGYEHIVIPSPEQVKLAHQLIDLGADLVIGYHPHVIQAFEIYRSKYIFYSLGNYFFPNFHRYHSGKYIKWLEKNNRSILIEVEITKENIIHVNVEGLIFKHRGFKLCLDERSKEFLRNISRSFNYIFYNYDYNSYFRKYLLSHYPDFLIKNQQSIVLNLFRRLFNFRKNNKISFFKNILKLKNINKVSNYIKKNI